MFCHLSIFLYWCQKLIGLCHAVCHFSDNAMNGLRLGTSGRPMHSRKKLIENVSLVTEVMNIGS